MKTAIVNDRQKAEWMKAKNIGQYWCSIDPAMAESKEYKYLIADLDVESRFTVKDAAAGLVAVLKQKSVSNYELADAVCSVSGLIETADFKTAEAGYVEWNSVVIKAFVTALFFAERLISRSERLTTVAEKQADLLWIDYNKAMTTTIQDELSMISAEVLNQLQESAVKDGKIQLTTEQADRLNGFGQRRKEAAERNINFTNAVLDYLKQHPLSKDHIFADWKQLIETLHLPHILKPLKTDPESVKNP